MREIGLVMYVTFKAQVSELSLTLILHSNYRAFTLFPLSSALMVRRLKLTTFKDVRQTHIKTVPTLQGWSLCTERLNQ